jgi:hypothetical protein
MRAAGRAGQRTRSGSDGDEVGASARERADAAVRDREAHPDVRRGSQPGRAVSMCVARGTPAATVDDAEAVSSNPRRLLHDTRQMRPGRTP